MGRIFLGNFEFEHALAGSVGSTLPERLRRINRELAFSWLAVAGADDAIVAPASIDDTFLRDAAAAGLDVCRILSEDQLAARLASRRSGLDRSAELVPWGWTETLSALVRRAGLTQAVPSIDSVRRANSRQFSFDLETEWNAGLVSAGRIDSASDLERLLRPLAESDRWVIKAEFGMSARERILGTGRTLLDASAQWVRRRLERGESLFFEPWVERVDEAGMQFEIDPTGEVVFLGITPLHVDAAGAYAGSRFDDDPAIAPLYAPAIALGRRAAERAAALGYFGPIGIDAMRYRSADGSTGLRPLQDINARHTMGRISLGFRRLLKPGEQGTWQHVRWWSEHDPRSPREWFETFVAGLPTGSRAVRTSPFEIDGTPTRHGTVVVIGLKSSRVTP